MSAKIIGRIINVVVILFILTGCNIADEDSGRSGLSIYAAKVKPDAPTLQMIQKVKAS